MRDPLTGSATEVNETAEASDQPDAQTLLDLSFGDLDASKLMTESLEEGMVRLAALSLPGLVRVVVTADFEKSYEEHVKPKYSECFTQERIGGFALAKTVTDGGSSTILVDAKALLPDAEERLSCPLSRILEHEGHHLLLRARHEDAHTTHCRGADCETPTGWLRLLAALAIEEFRVESALTSASGFKHENVECVEALDLIWLKVEALRGVTDPDKRDGELGVCFRDLVVLVAERAAGWSGDQPIPDSLTGHPAVSAIWSRYSRSLAVIPSSDAPVTGAELKKHVNAVAVLLEEWLHHLGFQFESGEPENLAFVCMDRT